MEKALVLFEDVAKALDGKVCTFGDDLALIITEQPTKRNMEHLALTGAQQITMSGDFDPLREYVLIKRLILYLEGIGGNIKPSAVTDALKYTGGRLGETDKCGAKVQVKNEPKKWDFSHCDTLKTLNDKVDALKAKIKAIETMLKAGTYVDPESGAEYAKAEVVSGGGETIAVYL